MLNRYRSGRLYLMSRGWSSKDRPTRGMDFSTVSAFTNIRPVIVPVPFFSGTGRTSIIHIPPAISAEKRARKNRSFVDKKLSITLRLEVNQFKLSHTPPTPNTANSYEQPVKPAIRSPRRMLKILCALPKKSQLSCLHLLGCTCSV